jgi:hypothetical protein
MFTFYIRATLDGWEKVRKTSEKKVSGKRFEPDTSRMQSRIFSQDSRFTESHFGLRERTVIAVNRPICVCPYVDRRGEAPRWTAMSVGYSTSRVTDAVYKEWQGSWSRDPSKTRTSHKPMAFFGDTSFIQIYTLQRMSAYFYILSHVISAACNSLPLLVRSGRLI